MMIDGRWSDEYRAIEDGAFKRQPSRFRDPLTSETVKSLRDSPDRYHLIASLSCPWSHRTLLARNLKGLEDLVPLQIAGGIRVQGYPVNGGDPWRVPGTQEEIAHVHELYSRTDTSYTGRATVPLLWDSHEQRILSNESLQILRLFDEVPARDDQLDFTLRPLGLLAEIEFLNSRLHDELANAVYRAGLARCQKLYEAAVGEVFVMLEELEQRLASQRFLFGAVLTESDVHLLPVLLRFDSVYYTHFRCCRRRLVDYVNLWAYARDLYRWRGVAATTDFLTIRQGYYLNDGDCNPYGLVAVAPDIDWSAPHHRDSLSDAQLAKRAGGSFAVDPITLLPQGRQDDN